MSIVAAIVVAAGRGARFGGALPKQYETLAGKPVLRWSLDALARHPRVAAIQAVIHAQDRALFDAASAGLTLLPPVIGGESRHDSVRRGLQALTAMQPDKVLIHDGARPLVDPAMISAVIEALDTKQAAIPGLAIVDTLKRSDDGRTIARTVARAGLWRAQTPQGFDFGAILAAHVAHAADAMTDDASFAEAAGLTVALVPGREENLKITSQQDLRRAERLIAATHETRTGTGFDVHRFGPGDRVVLCGVEIAHASALIGHSDADVGLHALTDALLGAIGAGDIGEHFPPSDPRWRGADSAQFLAHAAALVRARGGDIVNVDVTLVCEAPKIQPHRGAMRLRLGEILRIDATRCSVKATTTEGLGFAGRREGIAAQAVAVVRCPAV